MTKQLFVSHTWLSDEQGRDTHRRVRILTRVLRRIGWTVWFDETDMKGNIDSSMARGVENADVFLVCLTQKYVEKVSEESTKHCSDDNCLKEWNYAMIRKKRLLPIVFEACMKSTATWPSGVVQMRLGLNLYVDASGEIGTAAIKVDKALRDMGLSPALERRAVLRVPSTVICF